MHSEYDWRRFPETQRWVQRWVASAVDAIPFLTEFESRLRVETGTRLSDWVDHLTLGTSRVSEDELVDLGYDRDPLHGAAVWSHSGGLFPRIRIVGRDDLQIALKVDSVAEFLAANHLDTKIQGAPDTPLRTALVSRVDSASVSVIERHGSLAFEPIEVDADTAKAALSCRQTFEMRARYFEREEEGFEALSRLIESATERLNVDWVCDLFFAAEREYWQARNRAAQIQWERQNRFGLGWANHDHHTYRSSREHFRRLIEVLEKLGMQCRERFYGGADAGWGAQVLEQPIAGIVVFADVDMSTTEVTGDFAHEGLQPSDSLGTVGLWCKLHGEAMLQAGMHHLECQFDFEDARRQLAEAGIESMAPFTDFDHLKQSFTKGERWQVSEQRIRQAAERGWITPEQADRFRREGSVGSHLEVLQRWDGYKGFNQTGISEIIRETDPRRQA